MNRTEHTLGRLPEGGQTTPTRDEAVRELLQSNLIAPGLYATSTVFARGRAAMAAEALTLLASAPAPASGRVDAVAVKALEWREEEPDWWSAEALTWKSGYEAWKSPSGVVRWRVPGDAKFSLFDGTLEEAKAACEASYDKLIRSALSPAATPVSEAPERIRVAQDADGFWTCREAVSGSQEYVRADLAKPAAERIADTVLTWMIERDLLDAGNEYDAPDVLAVLNDLVEDAPAATEAKGVAINPWLGGFDAAMQAVLCGGRANRRDWNRPSHIERRTIDGLSNPTIVMVMKDGSVGPYTPSGCDMVASDWSIHRD